MTASIPVTSSPAGSLALRVGFVGAGQMGRPMVDRLVAGGFDVTVHARRPDAAAELESAGLRVESSLLTLAGQADLLIVCVFDDRQVRDVIVDGGVLERMVPSSVLVSHVTGSPRLVEQLALQAPAGVAVLDAPISGTADHVRRGELTVLAGGEPSVLARVRPALATYARPILHVGRVGDGQRVKLVNNLLFAANLGAAVHAAQLGRQLGMEPSELASVLAECSAASFANDLLRHVSPEAISMSVRRYLAKDVAIIRDVAGELGVDLGDLGDSAAWVFD